MEAAPGGRVDERRNLPPDAREGPAGPGQALEQARRIGMGRPREERPRGRALHLLSRVHHRHPVAQLVGRAEVVGGEQHRDPPVLHQAAQQGEDLRLDGHVERRRRLVRDDEARLGEQGHRDHQPLALAAAELVGELAERLLRARDLHEVEDLADPLPILLRAPPRIPREEARRGPRTRRLGPAGGLPLHELPDLGPDGEEGVERAVGVLGNERDRPPPDRPVHVLGRSGEQIPALELDPAAPNPPRRRGEDAEDRARERGLAAAALPDEAHDLARPHVEVDPVEHLRGPVVGREFDPELPDREQRLRHRGGRGRGGASGRGRPAARPRGG